MGKDLQLPSQQLVVERLLYLIEFNRPFIFLTGMVGSGRHTVSHLLLNQLPVDRLVVRVVGSRAMTMANVRQQLLQQITAHSIFNVHDSLATSFFRMLESGKLVKRLLLIEHADELPVELLNELWAINGRNEMLASPYPLAIILLGSREWCRQQLPQLKKGDMPPLEVEIMPLTLPEQRIFLYEKAKALGIPAALLPKLTVEAILQIAGGHPGMIISQLEDAMSERKVKRKQSTLPTKAIAVTLALVAISLLALSYFIPTLFDGHPTTTVAQQQDTLPTSVTSTLKDGPILGNEADSQYGSDHMTQEQLAEQNLALSDGVASRVTTPDKHALPPQVDSETLTTQSANYGGRRVVISDDVVKQIIRDQNKVTDGLPNEVVADLTGTLSAPQQGTAPSESSHSGSVAVVSSDSKAATASAISLSAPHVASSSAEPAPSAILTSPAILKKIPRSHYTIQLMGASNTNAVEQFIAQHNLAGKVWVYETLFRGKAWYVVIQGDHAGLGKAKSAIQQLSPGLLQGQPWPKSFNQIHKELAL